MKITNGFAYGVV